LQISIGAKAKREVIIYYSFLIVEEIVFGDIANLGKKNA